MDFLCLRFFPSGNQPYGCNGCTLSDLPVVTFSIEHSDFRVSEIRVFDHEIEETDRKSVV